MRFVHNDDIVPIQETVAANFCQQQPIGHDFNKGFRASLDR